MKDPQGLFMLQIEFIQAQMQAMTEQAKEPCYSRPAQTYSNVTGNPVWEIDDLGFHFVASRPQVLVPEVVHLLG